MVTDPTPEVERWCNENLVIPNPEYAKKKRMGFWTGNIPRELVMYEITVRAFWMPIGKKSPCTRLQKPLLMKLD